MLMLLGDPVHIGHAGRGQIAALKGGGVDGRTRKLERKFGGGAMTGVLAPFLQAIETSTTGSAPLGLKVESAGLRII